MQSVATRGWELPNLQEVQAKSDSLAASGFATVGSPVLSKATREAMAKQASPTLYGQHLSSSVGPKLPCLDKIVTILISYIVFLDLSNTTHEFKAK